MVKVPTDYMAEMIEKIVVERNQQVDNAILGEIQQIAVEEGIETKIILNQKNVADALRNFQDEYATVKAEVAREIFAEIKQLITDCTVATYSKEYGYILRQDYNGASLVRKLAELKKKYTEVDK